VEGASKEAETALVAYDKLTAVYFKSLKPAAFQSISKVLGYAGGPFPLKEKIPL
jgi:hypothetical protein